MQSHNQQQLLEIISAQVLKLVDSGNSMPIVIIDGRAGSGKSTLADKLKNKLFQDGESAPRVIHMDDLYEGWDGLEAGADYLQRFILNPLRKQEVAHFQEFDWALGERNHWREFGGGTPLIIEGCGSLNQNSTESAHIRVWLEVEEGVRKARWLKREGSDDHWSEWAAQELNFYAREKSSELADLLGN